jgi:plastocyanin
MSKIIPVFSAVRIVPREGDFLDRKVGSSGEIFYDRDTNTLRLYDGNVAGGISLAKGDLSNIDNLAFKNKADAAGVVGAATISALPPESPVSGESWVDANTGNFYVYYNDGTSAQWIQPAASLYGTGGGGGTVSSGITNIIAGNNITLTNNSGVVTINAVVDGGSVTLDSLSDVVVTSPSIGQVLKYNGTIWINDTDATAQAGSASNSFTTIAVAGQSNVVADSATDTLTLVAGSNITITTNASTDTVTIAASGGSGTASDSFSIIAVSGQSNVVADSSADTLTLVAGTGIAITTNAGTDTITIASTVSSGATAFTGLSDRADLTVDRFYLPAITMLTTTNNGASSYRFDQYGVADNPTVYAINGTTIAFNLNVVGHPFLIQTSGGSNYDVGLVHVTTGGTVTTGSSAQGKTSGTLYWKIPSSISGNYRYICSIHGGMVGVISIKDFNTI